MLTLKLSHTGNKPPRMSTILNVCAAALSANGYTFSHAPDSYSLLIEEGNNPFPPRKDLPVQLTVPAYNAIKALHDFEEDRRAQLLEDQGGKDGS